ncbi:MAG: radical SAM protein [Candidatus Omnitrophica bacterium]|nr:radical SAM protein [Candidatus Omnitrophota bacterium]
MSCLDQAVILWRHFRFFLSRAVDYPLVAPDMLQLCFLFRCNLRCKMCTVQEKYEKARNAHEEYELDSGTVKDLIKQASDMGISKLFLIGGEPFLREDLFDIIKFAHRHKMGTIVFTNGTLLGNPSIIEKTLDSGLHSLSISIDGACENTYRNIRGEGILDKIAENIRLFNKIKKEKGASSPSISIACTVMDQNIGELMDIVNLARSVGVDGIGFQPVVINNTDQRLRNREDANWIPPSRYALLDKSINRLLEYKCLNEDNFKFIYTGLVQLQLIKDYFKGNSALGRQKCYAGFNRIIVSQDGKVYFCAADPRSGEVSFGDIHRDRLKSLWYGRQARVFRKSIRKCPNHCLLSCSRRGEFDTFIDDFSRGLICKGRHPSAKPAV